MGGDATNHIHGIYRDPTDDYGGTVCTAVASPSPTTTTTPATGTATVSLAASATTAGQRARATVTAPAGSTVQLLAASRPSTTFVQVRQGVVSASGTVAFDNLLPATTTSLQARVVGGSTSEPVVLAVRPAVGLAVVRTGTGRYTFSGRVLPDRGQAVAVYRVDSSTGREVLTARAQVVQGAYAVQRQFVAPGRYGFVARTAATAANAAGASSVRTVLIR